MQTANKRSEQDEKDLGIGLGGGNIQQINKQMNKMNQPS